MIKKITLYLIAFFLLSSFTIHKFYVSIYQINYEPEKKRLQITTRIFIDDFNQVLFSKYHIKTALGEKEETERDVELMKKYLHETFKIKINGKFKSLYFVQKEIEGNVLVGYYKIENVSKLKLLEIYNNALLELNDEQQNLIHINNKGMKNSFLFSGNNTSGVLKY
ncbi:DUF6702 family protein [Flavobacterium oreochromis]|uniref:DUF6702 family protein n=1 Tax=Flavobacterium oreochromis TaxID=2906078 RepID=A0ABW8PBT9_9FLAO|nr:DUF6702 family protein [Flavobacterium oreochromis]OWP77474.1 hypothetical protein BWG23_04890 [Flavobacterium oreochromis]